MKNDLQKIELIGEQKLTVEKGETSDLIRLFSPENNICLSLIITEEGPILKFEGSGLVLQCNGSLTFDAETVSIIGQKKVNISSGSDMQMTAAGVLKSEAAIQTISAKMGNVDINANDDVTMKGERIKMNC